MEDYFAKMQMPCGEIGRALACSSDHEQAEVLNVLAREMKVVCRDPDLQGMQVCYFATALDAHGKQLVKELYEFIKLREETGE